MLAEQCKRSISALGPRDCSCTHPPLWMERERMGELESDCIQSPDLLNDHVASRVKGFTGRSFSDEIFSGINSMSILVVSRPISSSTRRPSCCLWYLSYLIHVVEYRLLRSPPLGLGWCGAAVAGGDSVADRARAICEPDMARRQASAGRRRGAHRGRRRAISTRLIAIGDSTGWGTRLRRSAGRVGSRDGEIHRGR